MIADDRIRLNQIHNVLDLRDCAFLCCASFESRSLCIPKSLKKIPFNFVAIFSTTDCNKLIEESALEIKKLFSDNVQIFNTKIHSPLDTANAMAKAIRCLIKKDIKKVVIDITTFTHEMLLILIKLLTRFEGGLEKITCLYLSARDYSIGDSKENKWLSKGCNEVRSVFGYPGKIIPGRPMCLIVLVGFEHERANRMIVEMDPEFLLLGKGISNRRHLTHDSHKAPMEYFHKLVKDMTSRRGDVDEFEFSCRDYKNTAKIILREISKRRDYNNIIVPLNTKISTISVAIAALYNDEIQVCYAVPEAYNFSAYSEPDNKVAVLDITSMSEIVKEISTEKGAL